MLNRSAHTLRYRRFANLLTDADARLAVEVVVSLLPPVGLSPTTLHQLAWRTDSVSFGASSFSRIVTVRVAPKSVPPREPATVSCS